MHMKTLKFILFLFLFVLSQSVLSQRIDPFLDKYSIYKSFHPEKATEYKDVEGTPYLNTEFTVGSFVMNDSSILEIPIRYNVYSDEMQYQVEGVNYVVGDPLAIEKVQIGESVFKYLPFINKGGFFELIETGKCSLVKKYIVKYKPAEGPKAIIGVGIPAEFIKEPAVFYLINNQSKVYKIKNIESVIEALQDQKHKIEDFIKTEKIKNAKRENLIKIVTYYNKL